MNEYYNYKTLQNDTFDSIALDFYDDEKLSNNIIQANPKYSKYILFPANIELKIPIIEKVVNSTLPPWKRA